MTFRAFVSLFSTLSKVARQEPRAKKKPPSGSPINAVSILVLAFHNLITFSKLKWTLLFLSKACACHDSHNTSIIFPHSSAVNRKSHLVMSA